MEKNHRQLFNKIFSEKKYIEFLNDLEEDYGRKIEFRIAESPIFVDAKFRDLLISACNAVIDVCTAPDFMSNTNRAIPHEFKVPGEETHPHFLAIDFGICGDTDGNLVPKMIELQGFPSLFAFENWLALHFRNHYPIDQSLSHLFNGLNPESYQKLLEKTIIGDCKPNEVVLLDIEPKKQKTQIDFELTKRLIGIETICISELQSENGKLYYMLENGSKQFIKRIYNRFIFDDLRHYPNLPIQIDWKHPYDVVWVTHPNWFYRISKFTLPFINHPMVPKTYFLSELRELPQNLEDFVLKPLFSFAGQGVIIDVTLDDIKQIKDPENWILQEKVQYVPAIESTNGGVKAEVRMLFLWPDADTKPTLATNLVRLSRGKMIGVRYNANYDWVGGSVGFFEQ